MESLLHRKSKPATVNKEDAAEYLDEEEQEKLIQELRTQNEKSNLTIQRGIVVMALLVSCIYAIFLHDLYYPKLPLGAPRIPMPFVGYVPTFNPAPEASAVTSIISIYVSIYTFIRASRLKPAEVFWASPAENRGIDKVNLIPALISGALASIGPALALYDGASAIEIFFWCIPILVLIMCVSAIRMMLQVEGKLEALDKARYKYKGA